MKKFFASSSFKHLILASMVLSSLGLVLFNAQFAGAANKSLIPKMGCAGLDNSSWTTNYRSPYSTTDYMCLGRDDNTGHNFYQFVVTLPGPIKNAAVSATNDKGQHISFNNTGDDTVFVSIPSSGTDLYDRGMGYGANIPPSNCNSSDKLNNVTIKTTGNGKTGDPIVVHLCGYPNANQALINKSVTGLVADNGSVGTTGNITGQFGAVRDDPIAAAEKYSPYEKEGITSIKLTGTSNQSDKNGTWYSLVAGKLDITSVPSGQYTLSFNYNDKIVASHSSIGDVSSQAAANIPYPPVSFYLQAGQTYNLTPNGMEYRNTAGKITIKEQATDKPNPVGSCQIDHIGWIICPVIDFMGKIVDGAYSAVSMFLTTPNINTNTGDPTNELYRAWAIMRTIANVAFVIVFLIIIFSQLTSVGITNYGVKKMLPRLVIAAILVNISYIICAIGVDVSNVVGSSVKQLFDSVGGQLGVPDTASSKGTGWGGLASTVVAVTVVSYAQLSILLPALITAMVAILTVFLVLTLRQALIIMLIVISPLAFVAFLLPNTENLFSKWRKMLTTLLLMFPIIAGIFGASALASTVVMHSAPDNIPVQIMGALVAIIPLFLTPIVMKTAGGVLNKFGGMINNPNKGPFDRMRKGAEGYRNNRKEYRNLRAMTGAGHSLPFMGRTMRLKGERAAILNNRKAELNRENADYISNKSATEEGFRGKLAKGGGDGALERAQAQSLSVRKKLEAEEVEQELQRTVETTPPQNLPAQARQNFLDAVRDGDTVKARANQKILSTQLGAPGIKTFSGALSEIDADTGGKYKSAKTMETMTALERDINATGLKGKDNITATRGYSGKTIQQIEADPGTYNGLTVLELANQRIDVLERGEKASATVVDKDGNKTVSVGISAEQAAAVLRTPAAESEMVGEKRALFMRIAGDLYKAP